MGTTGASSAGRTTRRPTRKPRSAAAGATTSREGAQTARDRLLLRDIDKVLAASYPGPHGADHAQAVATPQPTPGVTNPVGGSEPSPVSLTVIAMALALVAGFVDAVGFLHVVNVFPANQSGNVAFLGLSIGGASPTPGWGPPVTPAVGRWSSLRVGARRGAATLLGVELVLLTVVAVVFLAAGEHERFAATSRKSPPLAVAALAMGVQTDVIRSVAGVAVSTPYLGHVAQVSPNDLRKSYELFLDRGRPRPRRMRRGLRW